VTTKKISLDELSQPRLKRASSLQLSDAIATVVFMPTKLDRTAQTIADKINSQANDIDSLAVSKLFKLMKFVN
jgi:hypothetical protein